MEFSCENRGMKEATGKHDESRTKRKDIDIKKKNKKRKKEKECHCLLVPELNPVLLTIIRTESKSDTSNSLKTIQINSEMTNKLHENKKNDNKTNRQT